MAGLTLLLAWLIVACNGQATPTDDAGAYDGAALDGPASDFRLVDQNGTTMALSDFRGQVVVLAFLDTQCKDVCPLTALHLRKAYQALGGQAVSVVFLGVNVNVEANRVADVKATTEKWQLNEIPTWHFFTGSAADLKPVWEAYYIVVIPASAEDQDLVHTPGVFLIDQAGQKRWYVSTPFDESGGSQVSAPLSDLLVKHIRELLGER